MARDNIEASEVIDLTDAETVPVNPLEPTQPRTKRRRRPVEDLTDETDGDDDIEIVSTHTWAPPRRQRRISQEHEGDDGFEVVGEKQLTPQERLRQIQERHARNERVSVTSNQEEEHPNHNLQGPGMQLAHALFTGRILLPNAVDRIPSMRMLLDAGYPRSSAMVDPNSMVPFGRDTRISPNPPNGAGPTGRNGAGNNFELGPGRFHPLGRHPSLSLLGRSLLERSLRQANHEYTAEGNVNPDFGDDVDDPFDEDYRPPIYNHPPFGQSPYDQDNARSNLDWWILERTLQASTDEYTRRRAVNVNEVMKPAGPKPAHEGFVRSVTSAGELVCIKCDHPLAVQRDAKTDFSRSASSKVFVRGCGHVYCGECTITLRQPGCNRACPVEECKRVHSAKRKVFREVYL